MEEAIVTGVELIVAALAAGAAAGLTDTAGNVIRDAYAGLKTLLANRLGARTKARQALDAQETDPGVWQAHLGGDLVESGADRDEQVLAAARWLLEHADPDGAKTGRYTVNVDTNYGAAGTFTAPVTIHNHPLPPAMPGAQ
jgi:hypothetical protein